MRVSLIVFFLFIFSNSFSQEKGICISEKMRKFHGLVSNGSLDKTNLPAPEGILIIPVVVHIVHNDGPENISDSLVYEQIRVLNEDYSRTGNGFNTNPLGADMEVRFCLANLDPDGNPTTGITRIKSTFTYFNSEQEKEFKDTTGWDRKRYLNVWVVAMIDTNPAIAGYSYLASEAAGQKIDGIVAQYRYFGRPNSASKKGRTLTHEAGHYLDLQHIWGDISFGCGDDGVDDTPPADGIFVPTLPTGCQKPWQCGSPRQTENYMDYSRDECQNLFTKGQGERMRAALLRYRKGLISYAGNLITGCQEEYFAHHQNGNTGFIEIHPNPASAKIFVYPNFLHNQDLEFSLYNSLGELMKTFKAENISNQLIDLDVIDLQGGPYVLKITSDVISVTHKVMILH